MEESAAEVRRNCEIRNHLIELCRTEQSETTVQEAHLAEQQSTASALDELDLRILAAVVRAPGRSNKALAEELGVAESTCAYRIRSSAFAGCWRASACSSTRHPSVFRCKLSSACVSVDTLARVGQLFDAIVATPGVIEAFHVAGEDDFLVHVAVEDAAALRDIVLQHITVHEAVLTTETHLVFERREGVGPLARVTGRRSGPRASDTR
jgi:DNA-binding Lrp family transcriptional regulator